MRKRVEISSRTQYIRRQTVGDDACDGNDFQNALFVDLLMEYAIPKACLIIDHIVLLLQNVTFHIKVVQK